LEEINLDLSKKLVDQKKILEDNKALRDQFTTTSINNKNLIAANIVGSPSFIPGVTMPENYILDKGEKDGIKTGQFVIYKDNLVGKIVQASKNFSKVDLLTNQNFSVTAQTVFSNATGIVKGQGGGEIILDNVVLSQSLNKDDLVATKGDLDVRGAGILPNLILGKIISVNKNPSSLFQSAKIKTQLDFIHLSTVFIVKN
jgi:rod shape-determining protein MreC